MLAFLQASYGFQVSIVHRSHHITQWYPGDVSGEDPVRSVLCNYSSALTHCEYSSGHFIFDKRSLPIPFDMYQLHISWHSYRGIKVTNIPSS